MIDITKAQPGPGFVLAELQPQDQVIAGIDVAYAQDQHPVAKVIAVGPPDPSGTPQTQPGDLIWAQPTQSEIITQNDTQYYVIHHLRIKLIWTP